MPVEHHPDVLWQTTAIEFGAETSLVDSIEKTEGHDGVSWYRRKGE
jgi:hypothetical protein